MVKALVRDLEDADYERLKAQAAGNNRSLTAREAAETMRLRLADRPHSDSGTILAEERQR